MREVFKNLYVGSEDDVPKAKEKDFAVVHANKDGAYSHRSVLGYTERAAPQGPNYLVVRKTANLYLNLIDSDDPKFIPDAVVDAAIKFIGENLARSKPVLVHCVEGKSRGPTLAMLYLYSEGQLPADYHKAIRAFRRFYPDYDPALGMELYSRSKMRDLQYKR